MAVRVKICGITSREDALAAVEAGADLLGFNFHPRSPRYLRPEAVREIVRVLPPEVQTVGVFVHAAPAVVEHTALAAGVQLLQLHGGESDDYVRCFHPERVIRVLRVNGAEALPAVNDGCYAVLLDSFTPEFGGSGRAFDWSVAAGVRHQRKIVAGGLTSENVAQAIASTGAYAVDVCSGVECSTGKKDAAKMRAFIEAARRGLREQSA